MRYLAIILVSMLLGACAVKQKVLDASAVSMSKSYVPKGKSLKEMGDVTGQFCTDSSHKGSMGLMDETIKDAQRRSKVDFIINASFFRKGSCMMVEGTGAKLVSKK